MKIFSKNSKAKALIIAVIASIAANSAAQTSFEDNASEAKLKPLTKTNPVSINPITIRDILEFSSPRKTTTNIKVKREKEYKKPATTHYQFVVQEWDENQAIIIGPEEQNSSEQYDYRELPDRNPIYPEGRFVDPLQPIASAKLIWTF